MTNRQIGDMFGGVSYSAVLKANERFSAKAKKSRTLKRTVDKMSYVKGDPIHDLNHHPLFGSADNTGMAFGTLIHERRPPWHYVYWSNV